MKDFVRIFCLLIVGLMVFTGVLLIAEGMKTPRPSGAAPKTVTDTHYSSNREEGIELLETKEGSVL